MRTTVALIVVEGSLEVPATLRLLQNVGFATEDLTPLDKGGRGRFWKDVPRYKCTCYSAEGPYFRGEERRGVLDACLTLSLGDDRQIPWPQGQGFRAPDGAIRYRSAA